MQVARGEMGRSVMLSEHSRLNSKSTKSHSNEGRGTSRCGMYQAVPGAGDGWMDGWERAQLEENQGGNVSEQ